MTLWKKKPEFVINLAFKVEYLVTEEPGIQVYLILAIYMEHFIYLVAT